MANEELSKRVYIRQLKEKLELTQVSGDDSSLNRWVIAPDFNRPGLELSGYLGSNDLKRVVIIGNKEIEYINSMDERTQYDRFEIITDSYTPCIIVTAGNRCPGNLLNLARSKNFPIFEYGGKTYQLVVDLVSYLSEELAQSDNVHGVMLNIYGKGVLLTGKSGIGKSEVALELISRGHMLVADDVVEVSRVHNDIICTAPKLLKRMLEIRGLGVIDVNYVFGGHCYLDKCDLDLVIHLVPFGENGEVDRLNPTSEKMRILGMDVPMVEVPVSEGKSLSVIIETAVTSHILREDGKDTNEMFKDRVYNEILEKDKELNR